MAAKTLQEQVGKMKLILQLLKLPYSLDFAMSALYEECEAHFNILARHDERFKLDRLLKSINDICSNHSVTTKDDIQTDRVDLMGGRSFEVVKSNNITIDLVIRG